MAIKPLLKSLLHRLGYEIRRKHDGSGLLIESPFLDPSCENEYRIICDELKSKGLSLRPNEAMTYTMYSAVKYILENGVPGDIVECGVAKGTKIRLAAEILKRSSKTDVRLFLYDTFSGMPAPSIANTN